MPFPFDKYPWLNFQELNLAYFIKHFREIFQQWDTLLHEMYDWKDATDAELAEWKSTVETGISSWETGLQQSMEDWKDQTEADISTWEATTLSALEAWKTATTAVFEQIRTEAAASAQAAAGSASSAQTALAGAQAAQAAAEAAAAGIQSELTQIQTNTADIADLKTQLNNTNLFNNFDFQNGTPGIYIRYDGAVIEQESFSVSDTIHLSEGQKISLYARGAGENVAMISEYVSNTYIPLVLSTSSNFDTYTYTTSRDIDIRISYRTADANKCTIYHDIDYLAERAENSVEVNNKIPVDMLTDAITGKFIDYYGHLNESASFNISKPFTVPKNAVVKLSASGYSTNVAMISEYSDNNYTPLVMSTSSDVENYTYTTQEEKTLVFCYRTTLPYSGYYEFIFNTVNILKDLDNTVKITNRKTIDLDTGAISGKFIDYYGALNDNPAFSISAPIEIPEGAIVTLTARGYTQNVAMISEYYGGFYRPLVMSVSSDNETYTYTAANTMYVAMCYRNTDEYDASYSYNFDSEYILKEVSNKNNPLNNLDYLFLFHKCAGIGDSLMSGELVNTDSGTTVRVDAYPYSWLSNLMRYNKGACKHYSQGGMTTKSWLENTGGYKDEFVQDAGEYNAIFIGLGSNDKNQSVYPIGTISDTAGTDSFVGYYKEIIELAHTENPNAVLFCISMYDRNTNSAEYSDMVERISELYNYCFFVDFATEAEYTSKDTGYFADNSHYTALGYLYASEVIRQIINKIVSDNMNSFKWMGINDTIQPRS